MICKEYHRNLALAILVVVAVALFLSCHGCTIHFKGEKLEFDAERQRVDANCTYYLEKVDLFRGSGS